MVFNFLDHSFWICDMESICSEMRLNGWIQPCFQSKW